MGEKNDIHNSEAVFSKNYENLIQDPQALAIEKKRFKQFFDDAAIGRTGKKVKSHRLNAYATHLRYLCHYFKKDFKKITEKDIIRFYKDLENNKIKRHDGENYTDASKNEWIKALKKYMRWLLNDEIKFKRLISWVKEYKGYKEMEALSLEEVEKLAKGVRPRDACLIMFLFDSGARIEECLNVKIRDIEKIHREEEEFTDKNRNRKVSRYYYKIHIRISKTLPRTISIPLCTDYIDEWLKLHSDKGNREAYLFPISYDAVRMMLRKSSERILHKHVHAHLLRHSSATYYARILNNPFKVDYRYGWEIGSGISRRYIDRNGLAEEETVEAIEKDEIKRITKENNKLNDEIEKLREDQSEMNKFIRDIKDALGITDNNMRDTNFKHNLKEGFKETILKSHSYLSYKH